MSSELRTLGKARSLNADASRLDHGPLRAEYDVARKRQLGWRCRSHGRRPDRLIIAPHDLRTADATRAAEIYAGRFVFAARSSPAMGVRSSISSHPSDDWEVALLGFGWLRHLRAADTALTRANARSLVEDWISNPARKRLGTPRRRDGAPGDSSSIVAGTPGAQRYR